MRQTFLLGWLLVALMGLTQLYAEMEEEAQDQAQQEAERVLADERDDKKTAKDANRFWELIRLAESNSLKDYAAHCSLKFLALLNKVEDLKSKAKDGTGYKEIGAKAFQIIGFSTNEKETAWLNNDRDDEKVLRKGQFEPEAQARKRLEEADARVKKNQEGVNDLEEQLSKMCMANSKILAKLREHHRHFKSVLIQAKKEQTEAFYFTPAHFK